MVFGLWSVDHGLKHKNEYQSIFLEWYFFMSC